ncbi:MAG: permease-like cell division protein FtsX [Candidatus Riflemargulisbacteria bacterium]
MNFRILSFLLEEAISSIKQNSVMAFLSFITVTLSLSVLAMFLIVFMNLNSMIKTVGDDLNISVYLNRNISEERLYQVSDQLKMIKGVKSLSIVTREIAWEDLKQKLQYQKEIVELIPGNPLPDLIEVKLKSFKDTEDVLKEIKLIKDIEEVRYGKTIVNKFRSIVKLFDYVGGIIVLLLLFATFIIISSTINITIIAKEKEIKIMKLVGATNSFVKSVFVLEALILGSVGSLLAVILINAIYFVVNSKMQQVFHFAYVFTKHMNFVSLNMFIITIGLAISISASFFSVQGLLKSILRK